MMNFPRSSLGAAPRKSTVLASAITGFADHVKRSGGDAELVIDCAGLSIDDLDAPNTPIALDSMCLALDEAVRRTGDDNFGLHFGSSFTPDHWGLMGYLASTSATLGEALGNLETYFPTCQHSSLFGLVHGETICRLNYRILDPRVSHRRQDAELTLAQLFNVIRLGAGGDWQPLAVHFEHSAPGDWREHRNFFQADVRFGQPLNAIVFRRDILDRPMPRFDPALLRLLKQSLDVLAPPLSPDLGLIQQVRAEISELLFHSGAAIEEVAASLSMPTWTLRRRLNEEGVSFRGLVEDVRKEQAARLLAQGNIGITEIAFRLGYSEVSAFSRAFSRWYKTSPNAWRKSHI